MAYLQASPETGVYVKHCADELSKIAKWKLPDAFKITKEELLENAEVLHSVCDDYEQ